MATYMFVIERDGDAWRAYAPDLPGLEVEGESRDQVEQMVDTALEFWVSLLNDNGQPVPEPSASVKFLSVS